MASEQASFGASVRPRRGPRTHYGGSAFCDEDGDLAHKFCDETILTENGQKWAELGQVHKNPILQCIVKLGTPCIRVDPSEV